jgi:hypothetical protein
LEAVERGDITAAHSLTKELQDFHDADENGSAAVLQPKAATSALWIWRFRFRLT